MRRLTVNWPPLPDAAGRRPGRVWDHCSSFTAPCG